MSQSTSGSTYHGASRPPSRRIRKISRVSFRFQAHCVLHTKLTQHLTRDSCDSELGPIRCVIIPDSIHADRMIFIKF